MNTFLKNVIAILLLVAVMAPTAYMLAPQKAHALTGIIGCVAGALGFDLFGAAESDAAIAAAAAAAAVPLYVPVFDLPNALLGGGQILQEQHTTTAAAALDWKECVLDALLWVFKTVVLEAITASILDWIASGFDGAPTFITDFPAFLRNTADTAAASFLLGDEFAGLCDAFQGGLQFSVALNFSSRFRDRIDCTLSDVITNIQGFIDGFTIGFDANGNSVVSRNPFTTIGSISARDRMYSEPQNTPFGSYLLAEEELSRSILRQQNIELFKIDVGGGYASISTCLVKDDNGNCTGSRIEMPGRFVDEYVAQWIGKESADVLAVGDEIDEILGALLQLLLNKLMEYGTGLFVDDNYKDNLRNDDDLNKLLNVQLNFIAVPTTITTGQTSRLSWSTTGATSCIASGGWTGDQPVNGTLVITPTVTTTYTLGCSGDRGPTVTRSVTVVVNTTGGNAPPPPTAPPTGGEPDTTAPAAVDDLIVSSVQATQVTLVWGTVGDDGNTGTATSYDIRYIIGDSFTISDWLTASQVSGEPVPLPAGGIQSMVVTGLQEGVTITFAMKVIDEVGNTSDLSTSNPTVTPGSGGGTLTSPPPPTAPPG